MEEQDWRVLSPDGIRIRREPFESRAAAEAELNEWCKRFQQQGYYAVVGRIPLEYLPSRCIIEKEEE